MDVEEWLREELRKELQKKLNEQPWWCICCGMGGNYEGERPDMYWVPPLDHVCRETPNNPMGIIVGGE